ncbi:MAG: hypothetical protein KA248_13765 [Kiritimatiellae bacterium]|nr:hypothetical protein [Kiritimatiellia bacterium]
MKAKNQLTGMQGVYLVASELARHGFIASPTSRSARGADILVTDPDCTRAFSVQVKTNAASTSYWLLSPHAKAMVSPTHIYVFVNLRGEGKPPDFFVVPSRIVAQRMGSEKQGQDTWYWFMRDDAKPFQNKWNIFKK